MRGGIHGGDGGGHGLDAPLTLPTVTSFFGITNERDILRGRNGGTNLVTVEERVTALETEFRTELRHLATKSDLERLKWQLFTALFLAQAGLVGIAVAIIRFLPGGVA